MAPPPEDSGEPKVPVGEPKTEKGPEKPFYNKRGFGQLRLRMKDHESLEQAIERLKKDGWIIPDIGRIKQGKDEVSEYIEQK